MNKEFLCFITDFLRINVALGYWTSYGLGPLAFWEHASMVLRIELLRIHFHYIFILCGRYHG